MSTTRELRSEAASLLARRTEVTLSEWVQILRTWGPRNGRDEQLRWLQNEYGLARTQALAIIAQGKTAGRSSRARLRSESTASA